MSQRFGRKEPYTQIGVRRLVCFRCGAKGPTQQWNICADGNLFRPICNACDIALNDLILTFMRHPERAQLMRVYAAHMEENGK